METGLTAGAKATLSLVTEHPLGDLIKPLRTEVFLFNSYVAGTTHVKDTAVFDEMQAGDALILRREADNRFDANAILVLDRKERKMGYIPEKDNIVFARLMDAGKFLTAKIDRIERKGSFRQISIGIYLVDF
ncbi:MAG: HIRAN domain-containing protein [Lachnospiraceae bacterium]|nr:HIRAN domain-containing protein [Lachnospiraceae bacterium]